MKTSQIKLLLFIITILLFIELLIRNLYVLFPFENYQRYSWITNNNYKFKVNERGALGDIYKGQKNQIVFLGNSTTFDNALYNETLPERLKNKVEEKIGKNTVHIDNFSIGKNNFNNISKQIGSLCRLRRYYKAAVIQNPFQIEFFKIKGPPKPYNENYIPKSGYILQTLLQLKKWYNPNFYFFFPKKRKVFSGIMQNNLPQVRQDSSFQELFIDHEVFLTKEEKREISETITKINHEVSCISKKLLWMIPFYLWSESMLNSYFKKYTYLWRVDKNSGEIYFKSPKTLGQHAFKENEFVKKKLVEANISFIDLFSVMEHQITISHDLFVDEIHLSEKGYEFIANNIYPEFEKIIFPYIKR